MTPRSGTPAGPQISSQGRLGLGKGGLGSARLGSARPARYTPPQRREVVQIVANFFVAKIDEKSTKNRRNITKNHQKSKKCAQKRPRAPKSVTKRSVPSLAQLLGPFWIAFGTLPSRPGRALGRPKRSPERQNASQKQFLTHFFASYFHGAFRIDFVSLNFATICTETSKISVSPRREHDFHEIDFFV